MKLVGIATSFCAGTAIGFGSVVMASSDARLFAEIFSGLTVLGLVIILSNILFKTMWPGRDDWTIESSYKKSDPVGLFKGHWTSDDIQKVKADIAISIAKGKKRKDRLVNRILFIQSIKYRWAYPKKWRVTLTDENGIIQEWGDIEQEEADFGRGIDIHLEKERKVRYIAITIVEPKPEGDNSPTHANFWGFDDLRVTEVRFSWFPRWNLLSVFREWVIT